MIRSLYQKPIAHAVPTAKPTKRKMTPPPHHQPTNKVICFLTAKPTSPNDQQVHLAYIQPDYDDHDNSEAALTFQRPLHEAPQPSLHLLSPQEPASIPIHALDHVITWPSTTCYTIPQTRTESSDRFQHNSCFRCPSPSSVFIFLPSAPLPLPSVVASPPC